MYLVDTNIWLEALLDQDRAREVIAFLERIPSKHLHISDFSYHSIGVITIRLGKPDVFSVFTDDILISGGVCLLRLHPEMTRNIPNICSKYSLDFDDAYQYLCAKSYGLKLVSFDADFDDSDIERLEPARVV